jgi:hypothetical protein
LEDLIIDQGVFDEYVLPPVNSKAEKDSFNYQSTRFNASVGPIKEDLERAILRLERMLQPAHFHLPSDWGERTHLLRVIELVAKHSPDKSPGAIFSREGLTTNQMVFDRYGVDGILAKVTRRIEKLNTTVDSRYEADPIKIFIKREGHKKEKALQKRWRLIWGVSLIDQIIDRILYGEMLDVALENAAELPTKPGYSFKKGGVDRMVRKYGAYKSKGWQSFDSKGHDMSTPGWGLTAVGELNKKLCMSQGDVRTRWELLLDRRELAVQYGTFVFSDGTLVRKTSPGIQPSGRFTTIDSNSKLVLLFRVLYDIERGEPSCADENICMGDDTVLDGVGDALKFLDFLAKHGITWTIESAPGRFDEQNFCSMKFKFVGSRWVPLPLNWRKNIFSLAHREGKADVSGQTLSSLMTEYAFDDEAFGTLMGLCVKHYPGCYLSRDHHKSVITGFEGA